jgi:hypothetical protein
MKLNVGRMKSRFLRLPVNTKMKFTRQPALRANLQYEAIYILYEVNIKMGINIQGVIMWIGMIRLSIGTSGESSCV